MSYNPNWGFTSPYDEYGRVIPVVKEDCGEDENSNNITFLIKLDWKFKFQGNSYYLTISGDYEEISVHLICRIGMIEFKSCLFHPKTEKVIEIFDYSNNLSSQQSRQRFIQTIKEKIQIEVQIEKINDDCFQDHCICDVFSLKLKNDFLNQGWVLLSYFDSCDNTSNPTYLNGSICIPTNTNEPSYHSVIIENITMSPNNMSLDENIVVYIRFKTHHMRILPLNSQIEVDNIDFDSTGY
jgi:hypothetical protein